MEKKQRRRQKSSHEKTAGDEKSFVIESSMSWAKLTRKYIALRDKKFLEQSVIASSRSNEKRVKQILERHVRQSFEEKSPSVNEVAKELILQKRLEESMTIKLLDLTIDARAVSNFKNFPFDKGIEAFEDCLKSCERAIELSELLEDKSCEALFRVVLATGLQNIRRFEKSLESFIKAVKLYRKLAADEPQFYLPDLALTLDNLAILQKDLENSEAAEASHKEALNIYRSLTAENPQTYLPDMAMTLNNLSNLYIYRKNFKKAESLSLESLEIRRKLALDSQTYLFDVANTLNNLGFLKNELNDPQKAEEFYTEALKIHVKIYKESGAETPQAQLEALARTLNNLAVLHRKMNNFEAAEKFHIEVLDIYRKLVSVNAPTYLPGLAIALNSFGILEDYLNKFETSEKFHTEALKIRRKLAAVNPQAHLPDLAITLNNLASVLQNNINPEAAEKFYVEALEIYRNLASTKPQVYSSYSATVLNNLGVLHNNSHNFEAAKQFHEEALEIRRTLAADNPPAYLYSVADTLNNLAILHNKLKDFKESEKLHNEALAIRRDLERVNSKAYSGIVAETLYNLGALQNDLSNFEESENFYTEALTIYRKLTKSAPQTFLPKLANTLNGLGILKESSADFAAAEKFYTEALKIQRKLAVTNPPIYLPEVASIYNNLGQIAINKGNYKTALSRFLKARKLIDDLREKLEDINRRKHIFQRYVPVYQGLLNCYAELENWKKAIEVAEQSKSSSLNDHLGLQTLHPSVSSEASDEDRTKLTRTFEKYVKTIRDSQVIESLLSNYFQMLADLKNNSAVNRLKKENLEKLRKKAETDLYSLRKRRERLLSEIRRFDSDYPVRAENLTYKQILEVSKKTRHIIVLFRVLDNATFIFVIFPDKPYKAIRIGDFTSQNLKITSLEKNVDFAHSPLSGREKISMREASFEKEKENPNLIADLMEKINEKLIQPVRDALQDREGADVLLVTTGEQAVLPLNACFDKTRGRYLIEDFNVKFSTSVSLFKKAWENSRECSELNKLMFVTNPRNNLSFAEREVAGICKIYDLDYKTYEHNLTRRNATVKEVKKKLALDFNIIHFACHGNYKWSEPFSSPLEMAKDQNLSLKEIMQIRLSHTRLVVLSACKTGLVDAQDVSDEHYGFPFGFILSGASSVWGTLWSVDDKATSILMEKAYEYLNDGKEVSEALRQSQIEMFKKTEYKAPYYWAGFQHFGF